MEQKVRLTFCSTSVTVGTLTWTEDDMPRTKETPIRFCSYCGKKMERRPYVGRLEGMKEFRRRKYCSRVCMARGYMKRDVTLAALRVRARKFIQGSCLRCGTTHRLQIHHMDGNPANNTEGNVVTLCIVCHTVWHWENGKVKRRKQVVCDSCGKEDHRIRTGLCVSCYRKVQYRKKHPL